MSPNINASQKKENILIIENNQRTGEKISTELKSRGYSVTIEKADADGLKAIYDTLPQLVIIDLATTEADSENDAYSLLEKKHADVMLSKIPVFLLSTEGSPINMRRVPEKSVADFIVSMELDLSDVATRIDAYFGHTEAPSLNDKKKTASRGKKLLWVEDDKLIGSILEKKLVAAGFDIVLTKTGEEALAHLKETIPNLIMLDLTLPGMDGFEILQKIHVDPRLKQVPVMILSNLSKSGDFEKAKMLGATKYVVKASSSLDQIVNDVRELAA